MAVTAGVALTTALGGPALAAGPGVVPSTVDKSAAPGTSFTVDKTVTTPEIPPKPDIVLLVDTTGSMGGAIANVQANLNTAIASVRSAQPSAQFAVASYKDFTDSAPFTVDQQLTADATAVQTAVNGLSAGGGGDAPEAWINALYEVSTGAISYRSGSSRIVVLVGDAPSHDPSNGHTLADATSALTTAAARVVAVNVGNLDASGQATAVVNATGGELASSSPDAVTSAIVAGLRNLDVTVTPDVVSCDAGLSVTFDKADVTVPSGSPASYVETVHVAAGATQGATLHCKVRFLINGAPAGDAFDEAITVRVKDVTAPKPACAAGPNPGGHVPPPNEDGFFKLTATDNVDSSPEIYIQDSASSAKFGPYKSGTTIKLTQAPGATPEVKPGSGAVDWKVKLKGDAVIVAVDAAGNKATATCLVPPPPK